MQKPINAFMKLEEAITRLKVTLMEDGGDIPKAFEKINEEAIQFGNILPGTTADFYNNMTF